MVMLVKLLLPWQLMISCLLGKGHCSRSELERVVKKALWAERAMGQLRSVPDQLMTAAMATCTINKFR